MALAAPDYFAGANDPKRGAQVLFGCAGWIRRRCNEIIAEPTLDVFKIYDLASNCFNYRQEADKWRDGGGDIQSVRDSLVQWTREASVGNATKTAAEINADYKALYVAAGTFLTWATANLPAQDQTVPNNPIVTINRTWPSPDMTVRVAKSAAVTNQVTTLRAVFV